MFSLKKIHYCVGKASSTAADQDRVTASSHLCTLISYSFDWSLYIFDLKKVILTLGGRSEFSFGKLKVPVND